MASSSRHWHWFFSALLVVPACGAPDGSVDPSVPPEGSPDLVEELPDPGTITSLEVLAAGGEPSTRFEVLHALRVRLQVATQPGYDPTRNQPIQVGLIRASAPDQLALDALCPLGTFGLGDPKRAWQPPRIIQTDGGPVIAPPEDAGIADGGIADGGASDGGTDDFAVGVTLTLDQTFPIPPRCLGGGGADTFYLWAAVNPPPDGVDVPPASRRLQIFSPARVDTTGKDRNALCTAPGGEAGCAYELTVGPTTGPDVVMSTPKLKSSVAVLPANCPVDTADPLLSVVVEPALFGFEQEADGQPIDALQAAGGDASVAFEVCPRAASAGDAPDAPCVAGTTYTGLQVQVQSRAQGSRETFAPSIPILKMVPGLPTAVDASLAAVPGSDACERLSGRGDEPWAGHDLFNLRACVTPSFAERGPAADPAGNNCRVVPVRIVSQPATANLDLINLNLSIEKLFGSDTLSAGPYGVATLKVSGDQCGVKPEASAGFGAKVQFNMLGSSLSLIPLAVGCFYGEDPAEPDEAKKDKFECSVRVFGVPIKIKRFNKPKTSMDASACEKPEPGTCRIGCPSGSTCVDGACVKQCRPPCGAGKVCKQSADGRTATCVAGAPKTCNPRCRAPHRCDQVTGTCTTSAPPQHDDTCKSKPAKCAKGMNLFALTLAQEECFKIRRGLPHIAEISGQVCAEGEISAAPTLDFWLRPTDEDPTKALFPGTNQEGQFTVEIGPSAEAGLSAGIYLTLVIFRGGIEATLTFIELKLHPFLRFMFGFDWGGSFQNRFTSGVYFTIKLLFGEVKAKVDIWSLWDDWEEIYKYTLWKLDPLFSYCKQWFPKPLTVKHPFCAYCGACSNSNRAACDALSWSAYIAENAEDGAPCGDEDTCRRNRWWSNKYMLGLCSTLCPATVEKYRPGDDMCEEEE